MIDDSNIGFCMKKIHDRMEKHVNNAMKGTGLTLMQVAFLQELQEDAEKQLSMKELERRFGIAQSTVAGIVSRLEKKGFVEAFSDSVDKRIKRVRITEAGEKCYEKSSFNKKETDDKLMQGFSAGERALFIELLARAAKNLE